MTASLLTQPTDLLVQSDLAYDSGFRWPFFLAQVLNVLIIVFWVWSTIAAVRRVLCEGEGSEVPLWMLVIFLCPILGAVAALLYFRRRNTASKPNAQSESEEGSGMVS
ncbi:hypothetical protein [Roseibacillus ishigakijimensis]|uniref:Phospholipase_D-nuclease N-terminal n=1 Tax=Roseibacillus ishigakijimensis TaxID=454146 RepID=A0A934RPH9_9BACT|nr:hypothetical protein [Roseibacillus ishigakijimensis]MBK1833186.1 hypothetical protein [Roseibacillus ishigakijimensis]